MDHITFIMKPTHKCNAQCIYCSAYKENTPDGKMGTDLVRKLMERIVEHHEKTGTPNNILFTWHGGEPLLMGEKFYYSALEEQEKALVPAGIEYENTMQTNLLLLTGAHCKMLQSLLRRSDGTLCNVGTSFDPIKGIRNLRRGDYNKRWLEKKDLLRENGIQYGVVYVVHKYSLDRIDEIFDFFEKLYGEDMVGTRFNPLYPEGRARQLDKEQYHLAPGDWGRMLIRLYELWSSAGKAMRLDPLSEFDKFHETGEFNLNCEISGSCTDNHLGIDYDGTVYQCGRNIDEGSMPFGSIIEQPLSEILRSPYRVSMRNRMVHLSHSDCNKCKWWEYCHGGCPLDPLMSGSTLGKKTYWCESRTIFFDAVFKEPRDSSASGNVRSFRPAEPGREHEPEIYQR